MVNCSLRTGVDWVDVSKNLILSWWARAAAATTKNPCSGLRQLTIRDTGTVDAHINEQRHQHASAAGASAAGGGRPRTSAGAAGFSRKKSQF